MGKALSGELSCPCDRSCLKMQWNLVARTLIARLRRLFRIRSRVPWKKPVTAVLELVRVIFIFFSFIGNGYCVHSFDSPR